MSSGAPSGGRIGGARTGVSAPGWSLSACCRALGLLALAQARLPVGFLLRTQPCDALRLLLGPQLRLPFGLLALAGEPCRLGGGLLLQGRLPSRLLGGEPVAIAGLVHGATPVEAGALIRLDL